VHPALVQISSRPAVVEYEDDAFGTVVAGMAFGAGVTDARADLLQHGDVGAELPVFEPGVDPVGPPEQPQVVGRGGSRQHLVQGVGALVRPEPAGVHQQRHSGLLPDAVERPV
jgi:hypothetical protein